MRWAVGALCGCVFVFWYLCAFPDEPQRPAQDIINDYAKGR